MDRDPKYFIIGLSIIVIILGLALFLLWTSKLTNQNDQVNYGIYIKDQSLAGLQVDGMVTMKGIKVGAIKEIKFKPEDVERVLVKITVADGTPIKTDTTATVNRNLLTGLASIDLNGSTQSAPVFHGTLSNTDLPIIPEGTTDLSEIQRTLPEILTDTSKLLNRAEKFLSSANAAHVNNILSNSEKVSSELAVRAGDIGETITALSKAADNISKLTTEVEGGISTLLKQTVKASKDAETLISKANNKFENISDSISKMTKAVRNGKERILGETEQDLLGD